MKNTRKIKVTILGSGTCVPSLTRNSCSALVRGKSSHILLDAGPGTMGQLLKLGVHINEIDIILLSHFHLDHCAELAPFLFATKYPGFKRKKKITLMGGKGLKTFFENLNTAFDHTFEIPEDYFQIIELKEKGSLNTNLENIQLDYAGVQHRAESLAYRLTDETGFSIVYSGDTDYCAQLVDLSRESDILICESALPDGQKVLGHLTPSIAGKIATKANVKKLVLTHFYPVCDDVDIKAQCRNTFAGPLVLAEDLLNL